MTATGIPPLCAVDPYLHQHLGENQSLGAKQIAGSSTTLV
jgi:hypothetical protein